MATLASATALRAAGTHVATNPFFSIITNRSPDFSIVRQAFEKYLKPLYGDQTIPFQKLEKAQDRTCELMYVEKGKPVGILVYKRRPQDEFQELGIKNSLEVKTLMVLNPEENSGKGYGTELVNRTITLAQNKLADSIHLTVSQNANGAAEFFKKKGFKEVKVWEGKYLPNVKEHLFKLPVSQKEIKSGEVEDRAVGLGNVHPDRKRRFEHISTSEGQKLVEEESSKKSKVGGRIEEGSSTGKRKRDSYNEEKDSVTRRKTEHTQAAKVHQITLRKPYIHAIRNGSKTIEGRINSGMMLQLKTGDSIRFYYTQNAQDDVTCKITDIKTYKSFREMLENTGFKNCIPEASSLEAAVGIYNNISGYPQRAQRHGVLAIYLQVLKG